MSKKPLAVIGVVLTLCMAPAVASEEQDFLRTIKSYLDISEQFVTLADRKEAALFFAVEGIVEIHEERGEHAKAAPLLEQVLEAYPDNQTVRNIVRFKLRDVYKETGRSDLALKQLQAVIRENR